MTVQRRTHRKGCPSTPLSSHPRLLVFSECYKISYPSLAADSPWLMLQLPLPPRIAPTRSKRNSNLGCSPAAPFTAPCLHINLTQSKANFHSYIWTTSRMWGPRMWGGDSARQIQRTIPGSLDPPYWRATAHRAPLLTAKRYKLYLPLTCFVLQGSCSVPLSVLNRQTFTV